MISSSDKSDLAGQLAGGREVLLCAATSAADRRVCNIYCIYERDATQWRATAVMSQVACHITATGSTTNDCSIRNQMLANNTCYKIQVRAVVAEAYTLVLLEADPLNSSNTGQTLFSTTATLQLAAWQHLPSRNKEDMQSLLKQKSMHNTFIQLQLSRQCMLMTCLEHQTQVWPTVGSHTAVACRYVFIR
jgi:hypothetical protein